MLTTQTRAGGASALIRGATMADLPAVERLLTENQLPLDGVSEALNAFLVAESGGALVGVAGLEVCCEHALLRSVAVVPAWRSKGLGRELVTRIIADAESRGIQALYLLTTTADRYFPSFGFERIARDEVPADVQTTREFQGACPASATVMRRTTHRSSEAAPS
ncbi:MAG: arsenic resistance N-acetyltransferase ArsN2 [Gemmatimonadaceae bacterium]|nr:arsenic resistance N-acetyltransferase ArsN2 [Gemmatimonadaceae bacterium]